MPDQSPVLALPMIQPAQAQKHITHNEALLVLDALVQLTVDSHDSTSPPADPGTGARHIVAPGAIGAWAGQDGAVALWTGSDWRFFAPRAGWRADHTPSGTVLRHDGTSWQETAGSGPVEELGIGGATPDAVNRLAVASDAVLLTHDAAGDHRLKVNRADATKTASLLFQTGFSGGAEMGLAGSGDWSVKVSPDGTGWTEAITIDAATGQVQGAAVQAGPQDTTAGRLATVEGTYGPASLIGTVAETGGMPSGAVLESGADGAGGHYLRLADGSQVCWGTLSAPAHDISTASGGAFQGNPVTAGFAAAFAAAPVLTVHDRLVSGPADIWSVTATLSSTGFEVLPMALSARVQDRVLHYIAHGHAPGIGTVNTGTAPQITGSPTITGTQADGQTLTATAAPVTGSPPAIRTWQWERDGVAIAGATADSYTLTAADVGTSVRVVQTETNDAGSASATSATTGAIAAASFSPADLFISGEEGAWYDIAPAYLYQNSDGTGTVTLGDPVGYIEDRSGNGNHLVQATASRRGTLRQTAGGAYYIEFDGVDDRYQVTYPTTITSSTMCLAFRVNAPSGVLDDIGGENDNSLYTGSDGSLRYMTTGTPVGITGASGWTWGSDLYATTQALSDGTHTLDGSGASASASASAPTLMNGLTVGSMNTDYYDLDGRLYALVDVGRALTAGETSDLADYIKAKAGIST